MKKTLLIISAYLISLQMYAQWTDNGNSLTTSDKVGIGANPAYKLDVQVPLSTDDLIFRAGVTGYSNGFVISYKNSPQKLNYVFGNGNVGIGTSSPISDLEIANSNGAILSITTKEMNGTTTTPKRPAIDFLGYQNGNKARISAIERSYNTHGSQLSFFVNDGSSSTNLTERLTIIQNGNIGIGTINPTSKLEVNGDISLARTYKIKFLETVNGGDRAYIRSTNGQNGEDYNSLIFAVNTGNEAMIIKSNGNVGLGTNDPKAKLSVNGTIISSEIKVLADISQYPDFVFSDKYKLRSLNEVEKYIEDNNHLPGIPKADEVKEGIPLGEMNTKLLQKIEELTLYMIDLNSKVEKLEKENELLKSKLDITQ